MPLQRLGSRGCAAVRVEWTPSNLGRSLHWRKRPAHSREHCVVLQLMAQREETTISAMAKFEDEPAGSLLPRRAYDKVDSMMKAAMYGVCCKHMCVDEDLFMWKNKLLLEDKLVSSSAGMWFCRACNKGPFSKVFGGGSPQRETRVVAMGQAACRRGVYIRIINFQCH